MKELLNINVYLIKTNLKIKIKNQFITLKLSKKMKLLIQKLTQKIDTLPIGQQRSEIIDDYLALKNGKNIDYLTEKYKESL